MRSQDHKRGSKKTQRFPRRGVSDSKNPFNSLSTSDYDSGNATDAEKESYRYSGKRESKRVYETPKGSWFRDDDEPYRSHDHLDPYDPRNGPYAQFRDGFGGRQPDSYYLSDQYQDEDDPLGWGIEPNKSRRHDAHNEPSQPNSGFSWEPSSQPYGNRVDESRKDPRYGSWGRHPAAPLGFDYGYDPYQYGPQQGQLMHPYKPGPNVYYGESSEPLYSSSEHEGCDGCKDCGRQGGRHGGF